MRASSAYSLFDTESVWAILMRIAPPVMLAQLIQAMYNIVDSYFVGQFSSDGLTALSIVYPVQLIVTAIAVGTGVGVNTLMSRYDGQGNHHLADRTAGTGTVLALISWLIFAVLSGLLMRPFAAISTESSSVADLAVTYGTIVCVGSPGVFLESTWSKVHQARGNMRLPMLAQIAGAAANIVLDPILIFGLGPAPALGVDGVRPGAGGAHCCLRIPEAAPHPGVPLLCGQDLPVGISLHLHAASVHGLYHGPEHDPGRLFR